jgi:hypothetical protein
VYPDSAWQRKIGQNPAGAGLRAGVALRRTLIRGPLYMDGTGGRRLRPCAGAPRAAQVAFGKSSFAAILTAPPARGPPYPGVGGR